MRNSIFTMVSLVLVFLVGGFAQAQNVNLEVKMTGFKNDTGKVKVGLYDSEASFLKTVYKNAVVEIKSGAASVVFKDIPKGTYAVSVYHDENENDTLDRNGFGIPTEGYGTSNEAKGFMGPPSFADAKFTIGNNAKANIKISY